MSAPGWWWPFAGILLGLSVVLTLMQIRDARDARRAKLGVG